MMHVTTAGKAAASLLLAWIFIAGTSTTLQAQERVTATPVMVNLQTAVPGAQQFAATPTLTRTPTPEGPVQLEAREGANVRAEPSTDSEVLGSIRPGEYYSIIRQYYNWIEFQYDQSPTRRGWVYAELVNIIGDRTSIRQVETLQEAPGSTDVFDSTATALAITQTPGALLTATADARAIGAPNTDGRTIEIVTQQASGGVLPTYTYPPGIVALAPTPRSPLETEPTPVDEQRTFTAPNEIPPIVPIAALGGLGLLGLLVSSIRR